MLKKYLRPAALPFTFCPGCGCGTVLNIFSSAVENLGIKAEGICMVSGIGCSSWIPSPYFKADTLHTTHGRALAFASGVKVMKPGMKTVVISGDGDIAGIGGNHLIHAARRNIGITVIMVNNQIYGMTGGQVAPTTPEGTKTVTTPYGNVESPFSISEFVAEAGATFVARWTTAHVFQLRSAMQKALNHDGFAFIEVMSQCPEYYGRKAGYSTPAELLRAIRDKGVGKDEWVKLSPNDRAGRFCTGTLVERTDRKEYSASLREIVQSLRKNTG
jgi:2-oxoglutarate ferredoxin oxidoreductase subunit beta